MKKGKLFWLCYASVLVVFVLAGTLLAIRLWEMRQSDAFYESVSEQVETARLAKTPRPSALDQAARESGADWLTARLRRAADWYPDTAAWLQIPHTAVDYPVMLGKDNQFYLNHLPDGRENSLGSLFLDYRCSLSGRHLIIYGHNESGGKMFGSLKDYESQQYLAQHPTLTLAIEDSVYVCPIFSVRQVAADGDAYTLDFADEDDFRQYIAQTAAASRYSIDGDWSEAEGVVTLSTCTGRRNLRLVVQAILPAKS